MSNQLRGEILNAREVDVSGDLMRMQLLASSELQDMLGADSGDGAGTPVTSLLGAISLTGVASTYTMSLGAASALFYDPTDGTLTPDDSANKLVRWILQTLTFTNPDGANPRIDLVVATPTMVSVDPQTRNILTDPVTRAFAPQTVNKTIKPQAIISVIPGTPSSSPVPPALPAQKMAIAEVYVPAAASDATAFGVIPRIFRRASYPWSDFSGVVSGCKLSWTQVDPASASAVLTAGELLQLSRVVIDGETLEVFFTIPVFQDAGSNNPFASSASATWHKPYYIYLVGGRHAPQSAGPPFHGPLVAIESLVPPVSGRPGSVITTPRGTTTQLGAVYIGLGFVTAGSTRRLSCVMDSSFTNLAGVNTITPTNTLKHTAGSTAFEAFDVNAPPVVPVVSTRARVYTFGSGSIPTVIAPDRGDGTAPTVGYSSTGFVPLVDAPAGVTARGEIPFAAASPKFWAQTSNAAVTALSLTAFDHGVRRMR